MNLCLGGVAPSSASLRPTSLRLRSPQAGSGKAESETRALNGRNPVCVRRDPTPFEELRRGKHW
jgi:hypothetical protein